MGDITTRLDLLTTKELALKLKCTEAALRRMRAEQRGPVWLRVGRLVRYRVTDVEAYLQSSARQAAGESQ